MTDMPRLANAVTETEEWIADITQRLGWSDHGKAYLALLGTLHALRDCLARDEAIFLGAQLPTLLRGLYYEGWHPGRRGAAEGRQALLERIHDSVHREPGIDAEQVARGVLALLAARLPPAELEDVKAATPRALRALWPS